MNKTSYTIRFIGIIFETIPEDDLDKIHVYGNFVKNVIMKEYNIENDPKNILKSCCKTHYKDVPDNIDFIVDGFDFKNHICSIQNLLEYAGFIILNNIEGIIQYTPNNEEFRITICEKEHLKLDKCDGFVFNPRLDDVISHINCQDPIEFHKLMKEYEKISALKYLNDFIDTCSSSDSDSDLDLDSDSMISHEDDGGHWYNYGSDVGWQRVYW